MADSESESGLIEKINALHLEESLPESLRQAECPFTWQPVRFDDVSPKEVIILAKEKAEYDDLPLDKFIRLLTLVYEYSHQRQFKEAEEIIQISDRLLAEEKGLGFSQATKHLLLATRAHVFAMQGLKYETKQESKKLEPYVMMPSSEQAAVQALKAKFFSLYRKKGFQHAAESSKKALELNPEEPMWMFLRAESLRREAKYFSTNELPQEELQLLERAIERDRNPTYMVHLALRYNTCATSASYQHNKDKNFYKSDLYKKIVNMWDEATKLCKEALELAPNNEVINRRCGHSLMKSNMTNQMKNKELIKSAFEKALELAPHSSMTLHYFGKYYQKLENNKEKAEEFYEKAAKSDSNFSAQCDLIRLRFEMQGVDKYNPDKDFEMMLQKQNQLEQHNYLKAISQVLSYCLIVKRDLKKALEYFEKIIDEEEAFDFMKGHVILFAKNKPIDLYQYMANEIMLSKEEIPNKDELLKKIKNISPESIHQADEFLLDEIIKKKYDPNSADNASSWRLNKNQRGSQSQNQSPWRPTGNRSSESSNWRQTGSKSLKTSTWKQTGSKPSESSNWRKRSPSQDE